MVYKSHFMYSFIQKDVVIGVIKWLKENNDLYVDVEINENWADEWVNSDLSCFVDGNDRDSNTDNNKSNSGENHNPCAGNTQNECIGGVCKKGVKLKMTLGRQNVTNHQLKKMSLEKIVLPRRRLY